MGNMAIQAEDLGKLYRLGLPEGYRTFRETLVRACQFPLRRSATSGSQNGNRASLWALKDVSFDVKHGEVLGVIGGNGAGKSTLLKILSRISKPTEGRAFIRGRVGSLLEVGTGFHPELTGRENIFLNGAILGMRKTEIVSRFDEIVAFAEVEEFLDTPVKHYSSGMYVRLAFAIAAHLEPEILIVDEVLAVGDIAFQKKCLGKMNEVSRGGRTVLFVSHNMAAIENLCQKGLVLQRGKVAYGGMLKDAVRFYLDSVSGSLNSNGHIFDLSEASDRWSAVGKFLKRIELYTDGDRPVIEGVQIGAELRVRIHFELPKPTSSFNIGLGFNDFTGQRIFTAHSWFEPNRSEGERTGAQVFVCDIPSFTLVPGTYNLRIWLDISGAEADLIDDAARVSVIESDYYRTGKTPWNGTVVLKHRWYLEEPRDSDKG
jgi:lipopolysaccharide transport system ATP-binding protein